MECNPSTHTSKFNKSNTKFIITPILTYLTYFISVFGDTIYLVSQARKLEVILESHFSMTLPHPNPKRYQYIL